MSGYCYIQSEPNLWTVGRGEKKEDWEAESDHESSGEAAKRVAWLNGGGETQPPTVRFRVLRCPGGHELLYLDRSPEGDWTDLCPGCLADGDHNTLQVLGTVVLPFLKAPEEDD